MNVQSLDGNSAWAHFAHLADAARVRNAGFDVPLAQQRSTVQQKSMPVRPGRAMPSVNENVYYNQQPQKQRPMLGTHFDAYA